MTPRPDRVKIVQSDLEGKIYWTWTWGGEPQVAVTLSRQVAKVRGLLAEALPGALPGEVTDADLAPVPAKLRALGGLAAGGSLPERYRGPHGDAPTLAAGTSKAEDRRRAEVLRTHRCLTGPLSTPDREARWAADLAQALVPGQLLAEIGERARTNQPFEFLIMVSGDCAAVPWEILPVAEGKVLLDVATVTHFAPMTQRDFSGVPPRRWGATKALPPLWVIDPRLGRGNGWHVLDEDEHAEWARLAAVDGGTMRVAVDYDRIELSRDLLPDGSQPGLDSKAGRFFYLGHVAGGDDDPQSTSLLLGCGSRVYSTATMSGPVRGFSARDALMGTIDFAEANGDRRTRYPDAALADGMPREVPGNQLWPMPARVALIACDSGSDFRHAEPFGLVTAFFEAGAELITATRWALITDRAFGCYSDAGRHPLQEAALAVDAAHRGDRPVADIGAWQRERLARWRCDGELADSPLTWAALANHVWRPRANPLPPGLEGLVDEKAEGAGG